MADVLRAARGVYWTLAAWVAWKVFRDRKRMVDWSARAYGLLYPNRTGMVKSGPYGKEFGDDG